MATPLIALQRSFAYRASRWFPAEFVRWMDAVSTSLSPTDIGWVNVMDFGAVGDGIANDAPAVVLALAAVPATGGGLYFPGGHSFFFETAVTFAGKTDLHIFSEGGATIKLKKDTHGFDLNPITTLEIKGLRFLGTIQTDGGDPLGGNANQSAVVFGSCTDVNIHDCIFQDLGGYAVFIASGNTRVSVHDNFLIDTMAGIQTGGDAVANEDVEICDNQIKGFIPTGGAGTLGSDDQIASLGTVGRIIIARNIIDKRAVDASSRGKAQAQCIDITTVNAGQSEIICSENICLNSRSSTSLGRAAILIAITTTQNGECITAVDNEIREASGGIHLHVDGTASISRAIIARNQITDIFDATGSSTDPDGISVRSLNGVATLSQVFVDQNQIKNCAGFGIVWDAVDSISVRGNDVDGILGTNSIQGTTSQEADIIENTVLNSTGVGIITSDVHVIRCIGNNVIGSASDGITLAIADNVTVMGNTASGGAVNGIRINSCIKSTVVGNIASGNAASGFSTNAFFDMLFAQNQANDNGAYGLSLEGDDSRAVIIGNGFTGNASGPVNDISTDSNIRYLENPDLDSSDIANNRGVETITGVATTATVTFTVAEPDDDYMITLGSLLSAGAAAGSEAVYITNQATTGFTINCRVAPGGTETNDVSWSMQR